tara:strand:- start:2428 stop:2898 length:471 start_codon:yes stop_codon:yes gene_type:complete
MFSVLLGATIAALSAKRCIEEHNKYKIEVYRSVYGDTTTKHYYDGKLHNTKGPAVCRVNRSGVVELSEYYVKGKRHRVGKPAEIHRDFTGKITSIHFYENNELHRVNGPAEVYYPFKESSVVKMNWYQRGKLHNANGPAIVKNHSGDWAYNYEVDF